MDLLTIKLPHSINFECEIINQILDDLGQLSENNQYKQVVFDFSATNWMSAECTTIFGALFRSLQNNGYRVGVVGLKNPVELILKKNKFLDWYHIGKAIDDVYGTTIPYREFQSQEIRDIENYLIEDVFPAIDVRISQYQVSVIEDAIFEIVHNIKEHADSRLVFMCGQFFPKKKEITFAIADIGNGIAYNIAKNQTEWFERDYEYIDWATKEGTSTKKIVSSGLGLYDGRLQEIT